MRNNIHKTESIYKGHIAPKVVLSTISTLLLGFQGCSKDALNLSSTDNVDALCMAYASSNYKEVSNDGISPLRDGCSHLLGVVSYCKRDYHLGLIQVDPLNQCSKTESQKMGLIFYASRSLKNCVGVRLSNQGVTLSYLDGSSEVLSIFIEVQNEWMDGLSKEKEPLSYKDSSSKLEATYTHDFTILSALDYGIASLDDINKIVLLEGGQNKTRFEDINHAGFMVTSRIPASTELVQLVRHLATNTLQATGIICPASVCGNSLQPVAGASGDAAYGYIKRGNRYRLVLLSGGASSGKGCQDGGAMHSAAMGQAAVLHPWQGDQKVVKLKTADVAVQVEGSLWNGNDEEGYVDGSLYDGNDDGSSFFDDEIWQWDAYSDKDDSDMEGDMEDLLRTGNMFEQDLGKSGSCEDLGINSECQKDDSDDDGPKEEVDYSPDLVKHCDNNAKNYYNISFLAAESH